MSTRNKFWWSAVVAATVAGGTVSELPAQLPGVGGVDVPKTGALAPKVNGAVPKVNGAVPKVDRVVPNVDRAIPNAGKAVPSTDGAIKSTAQNRFESPQAGNASLGETVPLNLNSKGDSAISQTANAGVSLDTRNNRLRISKVDTGSIGASAGLQVGDEVRAVNRNWIRSFDQFQNDLASSIGADGKAWLLVNRNGKDVWLNFSPEASARPRLGINMDSSRNGIAIANVAKGSAAAKAGLKQGDKLLTINGKQVTATDQVVSAVSAAGNADGALAIVVERDGVQQTLNATVDTATTAAEGTLGNTVTASKQVISDAQVMAASVSSTLGSLAADANADAKAELSAMQKTATTIETNVTQLAQQETAVATEQAKATVQMIGQMEADLDRYAQGKAQETADSVSEVKQHLSGLRKNLEHIGSGSLNAATDTAAAAMTNAGSATKSVRTALKDTIGSATGETQEQLRSADAELAAIEKLTGNTQAAANGANHEMISTRLQAAATALNAASVSADADTKVRIDAISAQVQAMLNTKVDAEADANINAKPPQKPMAPLSN